MGIEDATTRGLRTTATEPARRRGASRRPAWAPSPAPEPEPGDVIGRYTLLERLGAGGMGVVLSAYDGELQRKVAIKVLRGAATRGETTEGRARLLREAQALARLSHPHVVEIFDVGTQAGALYIAMALVDGVTLRGWLGARPRTVREIVAMFVQAGQGLAAAHSTGLVHRDFKPGNVLVDAREHARVVDFGLALPTGRHSHGDADPRAGDDTALASSSMITDRLVTPVTEVGMVMGTPAYMAPEQHGGGMVGPAADQFAFCVALHEALHGARPFSGDTSDALWRAKRAGVVEPGPAGARVPAALQQSILRGLRPRPEERWPTMDALLRALAPFARPRSWGRVVVGAVAGGLVVAGTAAAWSLRPAPAGEGACIEGHAALAAAWGEPQRQALRAALQAGTATYAADTTRRVEARLDDYAARWLSLYDAACDDGEPPSPARARALECLEHRRRRMATLVEVLGGEPRPDLLARAAGLVQGLPSLEGCADGAPDDGQLVLPDDPATALRASEIDRALEEVPALIDAGRYDRARARATALHAEAEALGYGPLLLRTETWLGDALLRVGERPAAEAHLVHALHQAEEADDDAQVVLVIVRLVHATTDRPEEALRWARHGTARLPRIPGNAPAEAMMRGSLGTALTNAGRLAEAIPELDRAVALWAALEGPETLVVAAARTNLGIAYYDLGRFPEAIAEHEQALRIRTRTLGPAHPEVAESLNNLSNAAMSHGEHARSLALQQQALAIWQGALGPDHPNLGASYGNLGNAARAVGRVDEAVAVYLRSIEIRERALGSDHPELAVSLLNYGTLLGELGRYDAAGTTLRRARSILERTLGDHAYTAVAISSLGVVLEGQGDHDAALAAQQQALAMFEGIGLSEHPMAIEVRRHLGEVLLAMGQPARARPRLEQALALAGEGTGVSPEDAAALCFSLARVLEAQGEDLPRARALAERAAATWRSGPRSVARQRARVEAWLDRHGAMGP